MKKPGSKNMGSKSISRESRFSRFPTENPNPVIRIDYDSVVIYANAAAEPILKKWETGIGNVLPEYVNIILEEMINLKSAAELEVNCGGNIFSMTAVPETTGDYINLYGQDITKRRKRAETEFFKNEERFRIMGEILPYGIWLCDTDGRGVYTSASWLELLNMKMEDLADFEWTKNLVQEDVEPMLRRWMHCVNTGEDWDHIHRVIDRYGKINYVLTRGKPIRDSDGQIIAWAGINLDINDRMAAEEELRNAYKALERSREKLNMALDSANIGVWEWIAETGELIFDKRIRRMFGINSDEVIPTFNEFANYVNEEDITHLYKAARVALERNPPLETVLRTKPISNKTRFINLKGTINYNNSGKLVSISGVCFDITDLREGSEHLIIKLNEELLRSNKELENFAYVASHDLQEPLRMVASFTQLLALRYNDKLDDQAREYIDFAVDGAKRMYELLNSLLTYSRIHTKGAEFKAVDIHHVIETVKRNLGLVIKERKAQLTIGEMPVVQADESQMIQLFQNLIANAIKFSDESPRITVSAATEGSDFLFSVKDEGMGIDPVYFDKIFQIFQRLMPRDKYEGTGIGLAICKRIVERHGGTIRVKSQPGRGSEFLFTLPKRN
jgi:PAS domain S-box-containing protein